MNRQSFLILLLVSLIVVLITACSPAAPPEPTVTPTPEELPGKALVASRCGTCHSLNNIENASYDKAGWQATVDRMVASGALLDDTQKEQVVEYLAVAYPK